MDLPWSRSAEEAVTNILYNMPLPSLQPYRKLKKFSFSFPFCLDVATCLLSFFSLRGADATCPSGMRHVFNYLVQNEPGVLSRVSGILAGRGFNIDSLVVCRTEIRDLSRMCIVISGQDGVVEQARRQLEDLCGPYWTTPRRARSRASSSLSKYPSSGPSTSRTSSKAGREPRAAHHAHAEQAKLEREMALAHHFEEFTCLQPPSPTAVASEGEEGGKPLTPSEALRRRHQHLHSLHTLAN
ncbi:hypothetical protein EDB89DRAFT_225979 [Lactarius sanguifluus]|nr:hypothetical protein EDB89DRAFT_225979 [Lactarius sanguifluus]